MGPMLLLLLLLLVLVLFWVDEMLKLVLASCSIDITVRVNHSVIPGLQCCRCCRSLVQAASVGQTLAFLAPLRLHGYGSQD